jgi:ketosteroid isomerase-like protein
VSGNLAWVELSEMLEATHEGKPAKSQVLSTNLFERGEDGRWRLIHHHASPIMVRQPAPRRGGPSLH